MLSPTKQMTRLRKEQDQERDEALRRIKEAFDPKISELQAMKRREMEAVWARWREARSSLGDTIVHVEQ